MKNGILMLLAILGVSLMLFGCVPKVSEQETFAQMESLPPEQLEGAMAEDAKSIAGQAYAADPTFVAARKAVQQIEWISCTDSDGGKNPDQFGSVVLTYKFNKKEGQKAYIDSCDGNKLTEYYCAGKAFGKYVIACPNGCEAAPVGAVGARCKAAGVCGDGAVSGSEECDGNANLNGQSCQSLGFEKGTLLCNAQCKFDNTYCAKCGDGIIAKDVTGVLLEQCDDGNNVDGDGCYNCLVESGWVCSGQPSVCRKVETVCGNGVIEAGEQCDDLDQLSGDGCDFQCQIEKSWTCPGQPSQCVYNGHCGNGVKETYPTGLVEECDKTDFGSKSCKDFQYDGGYYDNGNLTCNTNCQITLASCSRCGDSLIEKPYEQCDDSNKADGDGCSVNCLMEAGWSCTGVPSVCRKI